MTVYDEPGPANPQTWNRYAYVGGAPLEAVDPLGLDEITIHASSVPGCSGPDAWQCWAGWGLGDGGLWNLFGIGGGRSPSGRTADNSGPNGGEGRMVAAAYHPGEHRSGESGIPPDCGGSYSGGEGRIFIPGPAAPPAPQPSGLGWLTSAWSWFGKTMSCAADGAQSASLAGLAEHFLGISGAGAYVADALGGNVFSGAVDLASSISTGSAGGHSVFGNMGLADLAGPGLDIVRTQGALDMSAAEQATAWAARGLHRLMSAGGEITTLTGTVSTAGVTGAEFATGVGELKFGYDALSFGVAALGCGFGWWQ